MRESKEKSKMAALKKRPKTGEFFRKNLEFLASAYAHNFYLLPFWVVW